MGQAPLGEECNKNGVGTPFVKVGQFGESKPIVDEWTTRPLKMAQEGDVLLCVVGATIGKLNLGINCAIGRSVAAIRPKKDKLKQVYIYQILKQWTAVLRGQSQGSAQGVIGKEIIYDIQIPLPPIEIQEEIVREIEGYQKIIDGAKMVVENYKPTISINPEWEMVELGSVCKPEYGFTETAKEKGDARFIRITDIDENGKLRKTDAKFVDLTEAAQGSLLRRGDVLVARTGATYGKTMIFEEDYPAVFASFLIRLNFDSNKIIPNYYWVFAQSQNYLDQKERLVSGGGQPQFNGNAIVKINIPVPSLEEQAQIVERIEQEQALVNANKQLISLFEQKIKDRINEVWGVKENIEI